MLGRGLPRVTIGYHVVARVSRKSREFRRNSGRSPRAYGFDANRSMGGLPMVSLHPHVTFLTVCL
jgi:hypothetical protein